MVPLLAMVLCPIVPYVAIGLYPEGFKRFTITKQSCDEKTNQ